MRKPLYRKSFRNASAEGEAELWRASALENKRCRDGIDEMIRDRYDGGFLRGECAKELCEEYGADRVGWVLAGNVLVTDDGRYRPSTKEWARSIKIPDEPYDRSGLYLLQSHPEVINGLIDEYRAYIAQTHLHGLDDIIKDSFEENYENRLLILKPEALSEDYRDGDYQYFIANSGFGCDPQKIGNENSKIDGLPGNRRLNGGIYAGNMLIAGDDGNGGTTDLTDEQIEKYTKMFYEPEDISDEEVKADTWFQFFCF